MISVNESVTRTGRSLGFPKFYYALPAARVNLQGNPKRDQFLLGIGEGGGWRGEAGGERRNNL
jgi:hypothetical protein